MSTVPSFDKIDSKEKKQKISGFVVERTTRRMKQAYQRMLKEAKTGITVDQWIVLELLAKKDGISQLEISKAIHKDAPTVTRIIDLLCKKDLLERKADKEDRRKFNILLTKAGKGKIKKVFPITRKFRTKAWDGLSDDELLQLVNTLETIYNNLEDVVAK